MAEVVGALGADVVFTSRSPKPDAVGEQVELSELLARADIVSLHLPLAPNTERIIDADAIASMRDGAILVNTGRGGLVDEDALIRALADGKIAAAGLDAFVDEPIKVDSKLLELDNVVLTPHTAWFTPETLRRSADVVIENIRRLDAGEALLHRVV